MQLGFSSPAESGIIEDLDISLAQVSVMFYLILRFHFFYNFHSFNLKFEVPGTNKDQLSIKTMLLGSISDDEI